MIEMLSSFKGICYLLISGEAISRKEDKTMKKTTGGFLPVSMCLLTVLLFSSIAFAGTLSRAEKLTDIEIKALDVADKAVKEVQKEADKLKVKIAEAHGMKPQSYMEWRSWVEFDGDYILLHCQSHMTGEWRFYGTE